MVLLLPVTACGDNMPPVDVKCPQAELTCQIDGAALAEGPLCPISLLPVGAYTLLGPTEQGGG